jgi:hypothetical protein
VLITQRGVYNQLAIMMNNVYECMKYEVMCYKECVGCYPDFSDREYIFSIVYRMVDSYGTLVLPYFVAQFIRYYCELLRNIQFIADNCTCLYEMRCECLCPSNF